MGAVFARRPPHRSLPLMECYPQVFWGDRQTFHRTQNVCDHCMLEDFVHSVWRFCLQRVEESVGRTHYSSAVFFLYTHSASSLRSNTCVVDNSNYSVRETNSVFFKSKRCVLRRVTRYRNDCNFN